MKIEITIPKRKSSTGQNAPRRGVVALDPGNKKVGRRRLQKSGLRFYDLGMIWDVGAESYRLNQHTSFLTAGYSDEQLFEFWKAWGLHFAGFAGMIAESSANFLQITDAEYYNLRFQGNPLWESDRWRSGTLALDPEDTAIGIESNAVEVRYAFKQDILLNVMGDAAFIPITFFNDQYKFTSEPDYASEAVEYLPEVGDEVFILPKPTAPNFITRYEAIGDTEEAYLAISGAMSIPTKNLTLQVSPRLPEEGQIYLPTGTGFGNLTLTNDQCTVNLNRLYAAENVNYYRVIFDPIADTYAYTPSSQSEFASRFRAAYAASLGHNFGWSAWPNRDFLVSEPSFFPGYIKYLVKRPSGSIIYAWNAGT